MRVSRRAPTLPHSPLPSFFIVLLLLIGCGERIQQGTAPAGDEALAGVEERAGFSFEDEGGTLTVYEGERAVLAYNYGMQLAPGVSEQYRRSTYLHPLWDLSGNVVTDDFPEDHYHHRGLSWMWPRVIVAGQTYDLWHINGVRQVFEEWLAREAGPDQATFGVKNVWRLDDGREIMDEEVWIRALPATEDGRVIDIRLTLTAREDSVRLAGQENQNKGYGGLSLRFGPREETRITTPEGPQAGDSDHQYVPWADLSGTFGASGAFSGVAIFQHAGHPDVPAAWTLRHYGFLGVAWPGNEGTTITPGESVTLRYRLWVHRGDAEAGRVAEVYHAYQDAPVVPVGE